MQMTISALSMASKSFERPDETRVFLGKGKAELVTVAGVTAMRATYEPGWRWSQHVKPIVGTASCQAAHAGYVLSGRVHVRMDDGTEAEFGRGDVFVAAPGHDAWTVGAEACVFVDFGPSIGASKG